VTPGGVDDPDHFEFDASTLQIWDGEELLKTVLRTNLKEVRKQSAARAS